MRTLYERVVVSQSITIFQRKLGQLLQPLPVNLLNLDGAAPVLPVPLGLEVAAEGSDKLVLIVVFVVDGGLGLFGSAQAGGFLFVAEVLLGLLVLGGGGTLAGECEVEVLGGGEEAAVEGLPVEYFEFGGEEEVGVLEVVLKREAGVLAEGERHRFGEPLVHLFPLEILDLLLEHFDIGVIGFVLLTVLLIAPEEVEAGLANHLPHLHVHVEQPLGLLILLGQRLVDGGVNGMIAVMITVVVLLLEGKRLGPVAIVFCVLTVEDAAAVAVTSSHGGQLNLPIKYYSKYGYWSGMIWQQTSIGDGLESIGDA